jgi:hypothetical protein
VACGAYLQGFFLTVRSVLSFRGKVLSAPPSSAGRWAVQARGFAARGAPLLAGDAPPPPDPGPRKPRLVRFPLAPAAGWLRFGELCARRGMGGNSRRPPNGKGVCGGRQGKVETTPRCFVSAGNGVDGVFGVGLF